MALSSRRVRIQEKRNTRRGLFYIIASVILFMVFLNFGIPLAGRLASAIGSAKNRGADQTASSTAPISPQLDPLPEFVATNSITLSGRAESGSTLRIYRNGNNIKEAIVDQSGNFSISITLSDGDNKISVSSVNSSNKESEKSREYNVILDNQDPTLEVTNPTEGENIYGSNNKTYTVKGKTEKDIRLTVNDRLAIVADDGTFTVKINLSDGSNALNFIAVDRAGNKTEKTVTVTFSQ
jgi:hypothetical protein